MFFISILHIHTTYTHIRELSLCLSLSVIMFRRDSILYPAIRIGTQAVHHSSYIAAICAGDAICATALHACWQGRDGSRGDTVVRERLDIYLCHGETSERIVSAWFRFWQAVPGTRAYTDALYTAKVFRYNNLREFTVLLLETKKGERTRGNRTPSESFYASLRHRALHVIDRAS